MVLVFLTSPLFSGRSAAQESEPGQTQALKGMVMGAALGGAVSSFSLGYLAYGLCESDCDHAFRDGFLWGILGGGVVGGVAGLVLGSAFSRGVEWEESGPAGPWKVRGAGGPRWAGPGDLEGLGLFLSLSATRPTTDRISWGVEASYLGWSEEEWFFTNWDRQGAGLSVRSRYRRHLGNLSLLASRALRLHPGGRNYILANIGVYPLVESIRSTRHTVSGLPAVPPEVSERSLEPLPGLGFGAGGLWNSGLGVEGRVHLILGGGDGWGLSLYSLGLTYMF